MVTYKYQLGTLSWQNSVIVLSPNPKLDMKPKVDSYRGFEYMKKTANCGIFLFYFLNKISKHFMITQTITT